MHQFKTVTTGHFGTVPPSLILCLSKFCRVPKNWAF